MELTAYRSPAWLACACALAVACVDDVDHLAPDAAAPTAAPDTATTNATAPQLRVSHPLPGALVPRTGGDDHAWVEVTGAVTSGSADVVRVKVVTGDVALSTHEAAVRPDGTFAVPVRVPATLASHELRVTAVHAGILHRVGPVIRDVVAGDVYIIQGQSNALAVKHHDSDPGEGEEDPWIRTFGSPMDASDRAWTTARAHANGPQNTPAGQAAFRGHVGQWALVMARELVRRHRAPIALLNGARGGQPIAYFQRNDAAPLATNTNYGRLLRRAIDGGLAGRVRAILYYQGESDQNDHGAHRAGFEALYADWLEDYPGLEHIYVTQIRAGCGGVAGWGNLHLQEIQRRFDAWTTPVPVTVMSSNGIEAHDGCHFHFTAGYETLGLRYANLLSRDLYGMDLQNVTPPDPARARVLPGSNRRIIELEMATPQVLRHAPAAGPDFVVYRASKAIARGVSVSRNADKTRLRIHLDAALPTTPPANLAYNPGWKDPQVWQRRVVNAPVSYPDGTAAGAIGLLTFLIPVAL